MQYRKTLIAAVVVASAVTVGGCHVFKQHPAVKSVAAQTELEVAKPAPTLSNLDLRVTAIEHRLDAAKAARARKQLLAR